jgi:hypothetical protein
VNSNARIVTVHHPRPATEKKADYEFDFDFGTKGVGMDGNEP